MLAATTAALATLFVALAPIDTAHADSTWQWPVEPARVVHAFDPPDNPWGTGHRGVDLAAATGQAIHAAADGSVSFAGVIAGRGVVVVSHGAIRTTYEPVQKSVAVGAPVHAGDVLGTLQAFAHHCSSPCLHWGAIQGDTYLDPTSFVVPKPSRLLPLWGAAPRLPNSDLGMRSPARRGTPDLGVADQQRFAWSDRSADVDMPSGSALAEDSGHISAGRASPTSLDPRQPPASKAEIDSDIEAPTAPRADPGGSAGLPSNWLSIAVLPCLALVLAVARTSVRSRFSRRPADPG